VRFSRLDDFNVVWGCAVCCCYTVKFVSCVIDGSSDFNLPGICSAKVHSDDDSVRRDLDVFVYIAIAIDDRRRS
jgi:hypothetical protein